MRMRVKKEYRAIGYSLSFGSPQKGAVLSLDGEWRDITEASEDGITWRIRQRAGRGEPVSFRVSVTGRTLAGVWGDGEPDAEALKCAMLMAIRDEVALVLGRSGIFEADHPASRKLLV